MNTHTQGYFKQLHYLWSEGMRKYRISLEGRMRLNTMDVKSKVESSYVYHVKEISNDPKINGDTLVNLITYDKAMLECTNQGFKEMFAVTSQLEKLYDEFEAIIDRDGKIKKVTNLPLLVEKWKRIKNEMVPYFDEGTDIESFFSLNDETMQDESVWRKMMNEQEFFFLFFTLPNYKAPGRRILKRENAFRNGTIDWRMDYNVKELADFTDVTIRGTFIPNPIWLSNAYGKMPFFNGVQLFPNFVIDAQYLFDNKTGFISEGWVNLEETVHPKILAHQLKFTITQIN